MQKFSNNSGILSSSSSSHNLSYYRSIASCKVSSSENTIQCCLSQFPVFFLCLKAVQFSKVKAAHRTGGNASGFFASGYQTTAAVAFVDFIIIGKVYWRIVRAGANTVLAAGAFLGVDDNQASGAIFGYCIYWTSRRAGRVSAVVARQ